MYTCYLYNVRTKYCHFRVAVEQPVLNPQAHRATVELSHLSLAVLHATTGSLTV